MATTDRTAIARPGLGDREPGRARPGGRRAEWWRGWFAPAQGLRPRPLDVLIAEATLVVTFAAAAGFAASGYPRGPAGFPAFGFAVASAITHDPGAAAHADAVGFLADGRIVDHMADPTAERVLDTIKRLGS